VPDQAAFIVAVATAAIGLPVAFVVLVVIAAIRRRRNEELGTGLVTALVLVCGLALGSLLLVDDDPTTDLPILAVAAILGVGRFRVGRRDQAGLLVVGTAVPWTLLWAAYLVVALSRGLDPSGTVLPFALGLFVTAGGLGLMKAGRRHDDAPPRLDAPVGMPGSRAVGSIAAAIREAGRVGPFGLSEIAAVTVLVLVWLVVPFLLLVPLGQAEPGARGLITTITGVVLGGVLATEAYIRAMPERSRRAFEAFSWLGEWDLRQARAAGIARAPTSPRAARRWLGAHPLSAGDERSLLAYRVDILALAGELDQARATAASLPERTPAERFERAAATDIADWRAGGPGNLAAMERAASEILPPDGDERLRAEVSIAAAKVRRRMADGRTTPGDALEPLLEIRKRLGARADGQVGRALRRRLVGVFLVAGAGFAILSEILAQA
jgi:hypothetical protein